MVTMDATRLNAWPAPPRPQARTSTSEGDAQGEPPAPRRGSSPWPAPARQTRTEPSTPVAAQGLQHPRRAEERPDGAGERGGKHPRRHQEGRAQQRILHQDPVGRARSGRRGSATPPQSTICARYTTNPTPIAPKVPAHQRSRRILQVAGHVDAGHDAGHRREVDGEHGPEVSSRVGVGRRPGSPGSSRRRTGPTAPPRKLTMRQAEQRPSPGTAS